MINIEKDFSNIPDILKSDNRKEAFLENVTKKKYEVGKNLYKVDSIQEKLKDIYNLKCAYCEDKLLNAPKHIEHYRPKAIYYWLSYSWDNLLLSCLYCNSIKKDNFETENEKVIYSDEPFEDIHKLGDGYDEKERPKIINPEKEDVLDTIIFDKNANISSLDDRVKYTIDIACGLNREELVILRKNILGDFIKDVNAHYFFYKNKEKGDETRFEPSVQSFIDNRTKDKEFYSFRYFILNNIEIFFADKELQNILNDLIKKLTKE